MRENRNVQALYELPEAIEFCTRCTVSNQRPRITLDEDGVCSACRFADHKAYGIDWAERERELEQLCDAHRRGDGSYDVIVPSSGGKDSSFVAHELKYRFGMNPLTVTWAPHLYTEIGRQNHQNAIDVGGLDNILVTPNGPVHRKLTRLAFDVLGDPFQPFIYGQTNAPLRAAVQHGVPLIMYGENGEVEYGGDMKNADSPTRDYKSDHVKHYFSGMAPEQFAEHGLDPKELMPYLAPSVEELDRNQTEVHFYSYYRKWTPQENFYYCVENTGFRPNPERSEGTYSKYASLDDKLDGFHFYLGFIKFGIGRCTADSAHEIRDGHITREEGVALVRKYDGEFPGRHYQEFLDYSDIDEGQFWDVVESWRSPHIWRRSGGKWVLRKQVE